MDGIPISASSHESVFFSKPGISMPSRLLQPTKQTLTASIDFEWHTTKYIPPKALTGSGRGIKSIYISIIKYPSKSK
jgi:hypothetical protein